MSSKAAKKAKLSPDHEATLQALVRAGLSDREAERRASLPQAFIVKARAGQREGTKSEASWAALAAVVRSDGCAPASAQLEVEAAPSELVLAIRDAKTLETLDGLAQRILEELAAERIGPNVARALTEIVRERRQLLAAIAEEKAAAKAGEPMRVDVVFSEDWRGAVEVDA